MATFVLPPGSSVHVIQWGYFTDEAVEGAVPPGYIRLYHYTDLRGAEGIMASKRIFKSVADRATDAAYGEGTYLTDKAPGMHTRMNIAKDIWNNEDRLHNEMIRQGRTDFVFELIIRRDKVHLMNPHLRIWLYPGRDLNLADMSLVYQWYVEETAEIERQEHERRLLESGVWVPGAMQPYAPHTVTQMVFY